MRLCTILRLASSQYGNKASKSKYEAVIVGAGHNGLVAAAYLAKSGQSVCVVERRHCIGGAAVTEEIVPGYQEHSETDSCRHACHVTRRDVPLFSRCSYNLSLLRPQIYTDLDLYGNGLKVYTRAQSSYTPLRSDYQTPGGPRSLMLGPDMEHNKREIAKFSRHDAIMYEKYEHQLRQFTEAIDPLLDVAPADIQRLSKATLIQKLMILRELKPLRSAVEAALKCDIGSLYELVTAPSSKVLNKWFVSEPLRTALATDAVIGAFGGPHTPGGGYVLLHHVMGEVEGMKGAWGYARGGMGAVSQAIANSAVSAGAEIIVGNSVNQILVQDGQVRGVELSDNSVIMADTVLSNASPKTTFLDLVDSSHLPPEFLVEVKNVDYRSPVTKINVAVNKLPNFLADPSPDNTPKPHHQCTIHLNCENMDILEGAYQDAKRGCISRNPMIEMTIPSVLDDSLAPPGHHVCLLFTQYTPYTLSGDKEWDDETREDYVNVVFDCIEKYAPGFKDSVVGKEVLAPPDLERIFGLTGGNIFHGAMSLDQLFLTRPVATMKAMSPGTPLDGLLLCGSGAHPGGGVMGAPGRLAAKHVITRAGRRWNWTI